MKEAPPVERIGPRPQWRHGESNPGPPACKSPTINRVGLHGARTEVPEWPCLPIIGPCYWHGRGRGGTARMCRPGYAETVGGGSGVAVLTMLVATVIAFPTPILSGA